MFFKKRNCKFPEHWSKMSDKDKVKWIDENYEENW